MDRVDLPWARARYTSRRRAPTNEALAARADEAVVGLAYDTGTGPEEGETVGGASNLRGINRTTRAKDPLQRPLHRCKRLRSRRHRGPLRGAACLRRGGTRLCLSGPRCRRKCGWEGEGGGGGSQRGNGAL